MSFVVVALLADGGCATGAAPDSGDTVVPDSEDAGNADAQSVAAEDASTVTNAMDANATHATPTVDSGEGIDSEAPIDSGEIIDSAKPVDSGADAGTCSDWAGPTVTAHCTDSCGTHTCAKNGCYNQWWCQISSHICKKDPPTGCN